MTEKICPVCNRSNLSTAKRCWYCQSLLEEETVDQGAPESGQAPASGSDSGENEVPEWLARIRQRKAIEEMQQTRSLSPENLPPHEEAAQKTENQPEDQTGDQTSPILPDSTALPGWLQGMDAPRPSEGVTRSLTPENSPEPDSSSWMEKLKAWKERDEQESETVNEKPEMPAEPSGAETPTEEWLTDFLAASNVTAVEPAASDQESAPEMTGTDGLAESPASEVPEGTTIQDETYDFSPEGQEELPGQDLQTKEAFAGLEAEFTGPDAQPPAESIPESPDILNDVTAAENADLDWLTHYQEPEPEEPQESAGSVAAEDESTQPLTPFLGVQKSDWGVSVTEPDFEPEEEAEAEEVEPAVLPPWMQNLRPIESIPQSPSVSTTGQVREGPLAGIEGALEGAGLGAAFEKPAIFTNKVQVTERQRLRAELFQSLLAEPVEVKSAVETRTPASSKWLKISISLILLAAVFFVQLRAPGTSLLPMLYPPETGNAYRLVNSLAADKPVMIVADFEAGLSEEISLTTHSLLEHLMLRNIPMAVVSTNPVGSTLMEGMLSRSQVLVNSYDLSTRLVDFGYLPGGSIGIQGLTTDLRTALPYDLNLAQPWSGSLLQNVHSLTDLGALVVVTDDADTGRYWVEQVGASLNGVPLILVTSAQAAPMLQPYYASGQVNAVVAGISGGSAYEQIMNLQGNSSFFFGSYQVLNLLVLAILLIGGIVSLVTPSAQGMKG